MDNQIRLDYLSEKLKFEKAKENGFACGEFLSLDEYIQARYYF